MELTGSLAGFAQSVLNLEQQKNELTSELEKIKVALAVADSRIQALEQDKVLLTSKLEYYQRRSTELVTRLNGFGNMILETLREEQVGEYRAVPSREVKVDMPSLVAKLPADATEIPATPARRQLFK